MNRTGTTATWALLLALATGAAAEEEEVFGQGHAAPAIPPSTDAPPADYTDDANAHDSREGVVFDSTVHYELRQGAGFDNKQRWAGTDFIHWTVHGAILEASGQIEDSDPAAATIASSEAWGALKIHAQVLPSEGDTGSIRAENQIYFAYNFLVSGVLGEASVQLDGSAYDILGKRHAFHLNAQFNEQTTVVTHAKTGMSSTDYAKLKVSFASKPDGSHSSASGEAGASDTNYDELDVTVEMRQASADGDNGESPTILITDAVSGGTPLERTYDVFSDGKVVLRARAGNAVEGGPATANVKLEHFKVHNQLRVWKKAEFSPSPPPPAPSDPGASDTTTPGGDGGGGAADESEPGDDAPDVPDDGIAIGPDNRGRATVVQPHGLATEGGSLAGVVRVELDQPAASDVVFAVAAQPATTVDLGGRDRLVVPAGARLGRVRFHGGAPGDATLHLQLLDDDGGPTGAELAVPALCRSVADTPAPQLWATLGHRPWQPGRAFATAVLPGTDTVLRVGRTGFDGFDDTATVVAVAVTDPAQILPGLPGAVTIPAGATEVALPVAVGANGGTARIALSSGAAEIELEVVGRPQTWRAAPDAVQVPAGAFATVVVLIDAREPVDRPLEVAFTDPATAAVEPVAGPILAGERARFLRVTGANPGATELRVESPGLPALVVPVEVVPATVAILDGTLRLSGLDGTREGFLRLAAPAGVTIESLDVPAEFEDFVSVSGLGTEAVTLALVPSPETPATLVLPVGIDAGTAPEPVEVAVSGDLSGAGRTYFLEIR